MGKKRGTSMSKRIKTRHKKMSKSRKIASQPVNPAIRDINKVITDKTQSIAKAATQQEQVNQTIQLETMTIQNLRKLTGNPERKQRPGKLSIDDGLYLQKLVKRWGTNYARMAQDIKLNRLQWTAQQIQKKHETYKKMFPEQSK